MEVDHRGRYPFQVPYECLNDDASLEKVSYAIANAVHSFFFATPYLKEDPTTVAGETNKEEKS